MAAVRGRHRLPKQRSMSRGGTVLGVATMAAVGVGGVATAEGSSPVSLSMPDLGFGDGHPSADAAGTTTAAANVQNAGEQLRTRILAQAEGQQSAAENADRTQAEKDAAGKAAKEAAARKVREEAAKKAIADKAAREKAERARKAKEEAERKANLGRYVLPTTNFQLTAGFGQAGNLWSHNHTGLDFAAPTGTSVYSVAQGEITSAGWAGAYGYRIIVKHTDGTETWYCHLSSMVRTSGKVAPGDTIGRVGATGNVTGPHLHLEVRPGGGTPIDPRPWLQSKGLNV
ncbi:M23 family metallopeptidase [Wenjunlia tyrosinilytica]|uniref:M23 family metallopeptidase n=1 Tax=Wenjunlia tyrosinilytica TaxID=1544741 RepID=UPI0027E45147|nr:M23 family metallopeptidase [Wenjunlia tyrosinilytica]